MTLSTYVYLTGDIDPHELFNACNKLIGAVDPVFHDEDCKYGPKGRKSIENIPGQGFPAWLTVYYRPDAPLTAEDVWVDDGTSRWLDQKACSVEVNFDTGYGYRDSYGGCADLHGRYIVALNRLAEDRGLKLEWRNEFTGEYFEGTDGLDDFGGQGTKAAEWIESVLPSIISNL